MERSDVPRARCWREITRWMAERHGVLVLGSLGFENAYALAMRRERARGARRQHRSPIWRVTRRD